MCSRPPQVPPAAPPCSLPGSRCLRMPRSLVVVPLGCSAAPVPDTSPGSSWARGRGRSLLSAPAWLVTIFCPPPSRCVPPPALGQQQWGPHWDHFLPTPFMPLIKGWGLQQRVLPFGDSLQRFFAPGLSSPSATSNLRCLCANLRKQGNNALLAGVFAPSSISPSWFLSFLSLQNLVGMMDIFCN